MFAGTLAPLGATCIMLTTKLSGFPSIHISINVLLFLPTWPYDDISRNIVAFRLLNTIKSRSAPLFSYFQARDIDYRDIPIAPI